MQGDELAPGGKNILPRGASLRPPYRRGRDRPLNPLKGLRKSGRGEVGAHLLSLLGWFRTLVMVVGEGREDAVAPFMGLGMGPVQRRDRLQIVVQQPGMIDK